MAYANLTWKQIVLIFCLDAAFFVYEQSSHLTAKYKRFVHPFVQLIWRNIVNVGRFAARWTLSCQHGDTPPNVIVAICGKKGSGKDTSTAKLRKWMWMLHADVYRHRTFAEPLKRAVQILTDCPADTLNTREGKESKFLNRYNEH